MYIMYNYCMRKILLLIVLMFHINYIVMAFQPRGADYEPEGFIIDFDINYGKTFDNNLSIINLKMFAPVISDEKKLTMNLGVSTTFSPDINIFDLYLLVGLTMYPFGKYLSLTFDAGIGLSLILTLNHFPYILSVKGNVDISIYKSHNITIGAGVQHRNTIKLLDYANLVNYYGIFNSYFFEIGYRKFIK
jgi:hypothetical protein